MRFQGAMESHQVEALVAKEGIPFTLELGTRTLIVKGDARLIFESFNNNEENLSYTGSTLSEAYGLASRFYFFKSQFVPRMCDAIADNLARIARREGSQV